MSEVDHLLLPSSQRCDQKSLLTLVDSAKVAASCFRDLLAISASSGNLDRSLRLPLRSSWLFMPKHDELFLKPVCHLEG